MAYGHTVGSPEFDAHMQCRGQQTHGVRGAAHGTRQQSPGTWVPHTPMMVTPWEPAPGPLAHSGQAQAAGPPASLRALSRTDDRVQVPRVCTRHVAQPPQGVRGRYPRRCGVQLLAFAHGPAGMGAQPTGHGARGPRSGGR